MTTDITNTHLEAAIIDQGVAGQFSGKTYAFTAVYNDDGWRLGVAVADEQGYNTISGKRFETEREARDWADGLNKHIGLTENVAARIVVSTMFGARRFSAA